MPESLSRSDPHGTAEFSLRECRFHACVSVCQRAHWFPGYDAYQYDHTNRVEENAYIHLLKNRMNRLPVIQCPRLEKVRTAAVKGMPPGDILLGMSLCDGSTYCAGNCEPKTQWKPISGAGLCENGGGGS